MVQVRSSGALCFGVGELTFLLPQGVPCKVGDPIHEVKKMQTTLDLNLSEKLSPEEIKQLQQFGTVRQYNDKELVYAAGSREVDLFVVLTGGIEVTNPNDSGFVLMLHELGEFSGDIGQH